KSNFPASKTLSLGSEAIGTPVKGLSEQETFKINSHLSNLEDDNAFSIRAQENIDDFLPSGSSSEDENIEMKQKGRGRPRLRKRHGKISGTKKHKKNGIFQKRKLDIIISSEFKQKREFLEQRKASRRFERLQERERENQRKIALLKLEYDQLKKEIMKNSTIPPSPISSHHIENQDKD
ncbi:MAG: hypothetical protein ACOCUI_05335, partial [bacterium]